MTIRWPVPQTFLDAALADPEVAGWAGRLGELAADRADAWGLQPDGDPLHGWMSVVWPVVDGAGQQLMLKMGRPDPAGYSEGVALAAWRGRGTVRLHRHETADNSLLLERLEPGRSLEHHPDVDRACDAIAGILANIADTVVPAQVAPLADEVGRMAAGIVRTLPDAAAVLPADTVAMALFTLQELADELAAPTAALSLLHNDCHFLNVLRVPGQDDRWRAIDPLPFAGFREWELIPVLRNRWADIVRTGDPDAALRRRVDRMSEIAGLNPERVRAYAQAVAVASLLSLLPHRPEQMFVAPYSVMARWR